MPSPRGQEQDYPFTLNTISLVSDVIQLWPCLDITPYRVFWTGINSHSQYDFVRYETYTCVSYEAAHRKKELVSSNQFYVTVVLRCMKQIAWNQLLMLAGRVINLVRGKRGEFFRHGWRWSEFMLVWEIPACLMCFGDYFFLGGGCDMVRFGRKLVLLGSAQLE